ncbi:MAG TPA: PIG-L deacetylase family protein [Thermomicrobiales bacterium]|jgi:LmbE family N-acetylglucosaminyl deacetylase|nr:PIG-L deacetylase family protein [Thermomicrobiales bacterium]
MSEQQEEFQSYLVIVAHPDDAEFGAAGTMATLTAAGKDVVIVQVTSGDKGSGDPKASPQLVAATREEEEREAARRLGVREVVFLREPDSEVVPDVKFRERLVRQIRTFRPDVVITHDAFRPYALHPDHRAVGLATTDAVYPAARDPLNFPHHLRDGLYTHKTAEIWYFGADAPDRHIDITDAFDAKINALMAHASQVGDEATLRERLRERAVEVAADQDFELAEAFKVVQFRR